MNCRFSGEQRIAVSVFAVFAVGVRSRPVGFPEDAAEMACVGESGELCNAVELHIGAFEQMFCIKNALFHEELSRSLAALFPEIILEIFFRQIEMRRQSPDVCSLNVIPNPACGFAREFCIAVVVFRGFQFILQFQKNCAGGFLDVAGSQIVMQSQTEQMLEFRDACGVSAEQTDRLSLRDFFKDPLREFAAETDVDVAPVMVVRSVEFKFVFVGDEEAAFRREVVFPDSAGRL